jgi:hypothetical protein
MVIQIQKSATPQQIKVALEKIKNKKKLAKGFPDLDKFFGSIEQQDFVTAQKNMRDEWE